MRGPTLSYVRTSTTTGSYVVLGRIYAQHFIGMAFAIFAREREREEGMNQPPTKSFLVIGYHQAVFCDAIFLFKN